MTEFDKNHIATLKDYAQKHGWKWIKTTDPYMISFEKGEHKDWNRINIWTSNKRRWSYTIGTYLTHPKQGKTQLFRRDVSIEEVEKYFAKPRVHTKKGYKTK